MLPFAERFVYWCVWISGVLYSLYSFCSSVNRKFSDLEPSDFADGWHILQRKKDLSDVEWVVFTTAFSKYWFLILVQIICTQFLLAKFPRTLPVFYSVYSVLCVLLIVGPYVTVVYLLYIILMCFVCVLGKKTVCYAVTVTSLYCLHQECFTKARNYYVSEQVEGFLVDVGFVWLVARCLSFTVDRINSNCAKFEARDFALIVSYSLYLPSMFSGPLVLYSAFVEQVSSGSRVWSLDRSLSSMKALLHPLCAFFMLEFLLHHVYSSAVQFYPDVASEFDAWALCGLGYALPVIFYLKYFVIYSLAGAIARTEYITFPPPPKCISRLHLPSQLWRTFDRGLYEWILWYLYIPVTKGRRTVFRRLLALAVCFAFVCIWHGMDKAVCTWTLLNFLNLAGEVATFLAFPSLACGKHGRCLSSSEKRLSALLSVPHFLVMCVSCTFFLANYEVGSLIFKRIILDGSIPLLVVATIMYCGCHVSLDAREYEENVKCSRKLKTEFQ